MKPTSPPGDYSRLTGRVSSSRSKRRLMALVVVAVLLPVVPSVGQAGMGRVAPGTWTGSILVDEDLTGGTVAGEGEFQLDADSNRRVDGVLSFNARWDARGVIAGDTTDVSISYAADNWDISGDGVLSSNALVFMTSGMITARGEIVVTQDGKSAPFELDDMQPESATITMTSVTCMSMSGMLFGRVPIALGTDRQPVTRIVDDHAPKPAAQADHYVSAEKTPHRLSMTRDIGRLSPSSMKWIRPTEDSNHFDPNGNRSELGRKSMVMRASLSRCSTVPHY